MPDQLNVEIFSLASRLSRDLRLNLEFPGEQSAFQTSPETYPTLPSPKGMLSQSWGNLPYISFEHLGGKFRVLRLWVMKWF